MLLLRNCHSATAGWKSAAVLSVWDEAMLGGLSAAGWSGRAAPGKRCQSQPLLPPRTLA